MKLVYAPQWMLTALEAAHVPFAKLFDLESLLGTLSYPDVASYLAYNAPESLGSFIPRPVLESFTPLAQCLVVADSVRSELNSAIQARSLNQASPITPEVDAMESKGLVLSTDLIGEDAILIRFVSKEGLSSDLSDSLGFYTRLITQLSMHQSFETIMGLPVMNAYLSLKRIALAA